MKQKHTNKDKIDIDKKALEQFNELKALIDANELVDLLTEVLNKYNDVKKKETAD